jgi:hypothetical protein
MQRTWELCEQQMVAAIVSSLVIMIYGLLNPEGAG